MTYAFFAGLLGGIVASALGTLFYRESNDALKGRIHELLLENELLRSLILEKNK